MSTQQILEIFKGKQIQATAVRMLVLEQLLGKPAAQSLHDLEKCLPHSDRSTIFRTLKTFEQKGLVHVVTDGTGIQCYALCADACNAEHHHDVHPHFYCVRCQRTICLEAIGLPGLELPSGYQVQQLMLRIDGICPDCKRT